MSESLVTKVSDTRPDAQSIEKPLGGWQFIWYDQEDHAPRSARPTAAGVRDETPSAPTPVTEISSTPFSEEPSR